MWRIESELVSAGTSYDRRAVLYDRLVRSRIYNRIAWSSAPSDYADFAAAAFGSSDGPLLEAAAGSAAATAPLHGNTTRSTVLVDLSRAMLERAAERIGAVGTNDEIPVRVRLVQADILALPMALDGFTTILGLGLTHLFDDIPGLVGALRDRLAPGGRIYLAGLVAETRRGRHYLELLRRAGEVAAPRTAEELRSALGHPASFRVTGCMAYVTLGA